MKYIFYQVRITKLYSSFQQNNILFLFPISAYDTLITVAEFTKIVIWYAIA